MADWSSVALAGVSAGAGVVGGFIGYLGARLQAAVGVRQIESEADRLRLVHSEEHLRNRQNTYHQLLDVEQQYLAIASRAPDCTREEYDEWLVAYHHTYDGVILFGTAAVRDAAEAINDAHYAIHSDMGRDGGPFGERFVRAYMPHQAEYRDGRDALIAAMRADVAPPA